MDFLPRQTMRSLLLGAALVLGLAHFSLAGETTVSRYLEFRDGSVLKLPVVDEEWNITILRRNGGSGETKVKLSDLHSLTLTPEPGFAKKRALLAAVQQLGSDEFREREQATTALLKMGPVIRADLETC